MRPEILLAHEFVECVPEELKDRTLYISTKYATAVHKCCCGCGREVVTPLSPTAWELTFNGKTVSLYPSIGSWSLPCQSHYFIRENRVVWAPRWSKDQIAKGRELEARARGEYFAAGRTPPRQEEVISAASPATPKPRDSLWKKVKKWLS